MILKLSNLAGTRETRRGQQRFQNGLAILFVIPLLLLVFIPLILSWYEFPILKMALATLLGLICCYPSLRYYVYQESGLPSLPLLCLAYGLQFALPVFIRAPSIILAGGYESLLEENQVNIALMYSILGMLGIQLAYYSTLGRRWLNSLKPVKLEVDNERSKIYCVVIVFLTPLTGSLTSVFGDQNTSLQFGAVVRVLQGQVLVVIVLLLHLLMTGRINKLYYLPLASLVAILLIQGVASGNLESAVVPLATFLLARWQITKRIPVLEVSLGLLLIFFFSPTKADYRKDAWYGMDVNIAESNSQIERAQHWITQATEFWSTVLNGGTSFLESTGTTTGRLDLIHQFTHICNLTPSVVPFQNGSTYSYFLVAFIPRIIWPNKPEAGAANRFFAVNYGITTEAGAERTTFGMSLMAESYINFSWPGVIIIMSMQGLLLGILQHFFSSESAGVGAQAIFVSVFVYFLNGVGTSAEILFGNLIQILIFNIFLIAWIRARDTSAEKTHMLT